MWATYSMLVDVDVSMGIAAVIRRELNISNMDMEDPGLVGVEEPRETR